MLTCFTCSPQPIRGGSLVDIIFRTQLYQIQFFIKEILILYMNYFMNI